MTAHIFFLPADTYFQILGHFFSIQWFYIPRSQISLKSISNSMFSLSIDKARHVQSVTHQTMGLALEHRIEDKEPLWSVLDYCLYGNVFPCFLCSA